jgi:4-hydroxyphenylpyruvate dioxygenase
MAESNSINEPAEGKKNLKLKNIRLYGGPGIQHIAIATDDIIKTVSQLRARGVEFYQRPHITYHTIPGLGEHNEDEEDLKEIEN